ncbi:hypothetical protein EN827_09780 [Mesorhizobium sp. M1D.F.Ca.ET.184.01.1.1]|nr:hypothetical protein EN877_09780 [Mesorhizobium sp. M1D.F.Ca.ET.234.01.1.1]TGS49004.1 hypothetical protein EN827_09780 [Mesorhizobium sp. M1D.F.Ca.ET.184.01.1.1]TGS63204.1 hypothetical protein EN826_009780 [Mesorhizobium sp. M1D.F.Ca.ET.183.01.1.1]
MRRSWRRPRAIPGKVCNGFPSGIAQKQILRAARRFYESLKRSRPRPAGRNRRVPPRPLSRRQERVWTVETLSPASAGSAAGRRRRRPSRTPPASRSRRRPR